MNRVGNVIMYGKTELMVMIAGDKWLRCLSSLEFISFFLREMGMKR